MTGGTQNKFSVQQQQLSTGSVHSPVALISIAVGSAEMYRLALLLRNLEPSFYSLSQRSIDLHRHCAYGLL